MKALRVEQQSLYIIRHRHPAVLQWLVARPVSGLASFDLSPSQACAQWHVDRPALAYRCGGSTGVANIVRAPVSQFHLACRNTAKAPDN